MTQRIGVLTFHRANNLGAVLQAYALSTYLNENICPTEIIDFYPNNSLPVKNTVFRKLVRIVKETLGGQLQKERYCRFDKFNDFINLYHLSPQSYYGDKEIQLNPPQYDLLISGSDQILNTTLTGNSKAFYLEFAKNTPKISYASSFGRSQISDCEVDYIRHYLKDFQALSAREESGKKIIEHELRKPVELVLDPVFLLTGDEWEKMSLPLKEEKYIFVYAMENTPWLIEAIRKTKEYYKLPVKIVLGGSFQLPIEGVVDNCCGPREFLSYVKNAECVVTNSFHGTAFSIIFEKKFLCVAHSSKNTRLENICNMTDTFKQIVVDNDEITDIEKKVIDGHKAYQRIIASIESSKNYLFDNIKPLIKKDIASILEHDKCCGCETCTQVCGRNAITFINDDTGFSYPQVDYLKCTQCGICAARCPAIMKVDGKQPMQVFAVRHVDDTVVQKSTSGGAFTALSDYVLQNGGIVFGAALNKNFECQHILADNENDRNLMRGAKYVQSRIGNSFILAKEALLQGRKVLFSGTPCQIAGLRNYLKGVDQSNLIMVDIICHGVPSPQIFKEHLQSLKEKRGNVKQYVFRSKDIGWHGLNVKVVFADGVNETNTINTNSYSRLYFNSLITRKSCFDCQYANLERISDITISDFWSIGNTDTNLNDEKGTSCVYVNTNKGKQVFNQVLLNLNVEEHTLEESMQPNLNNPTEKNEDYDLFWKDYYDNGFDYCVRKYTLGHIYFRYRKIIKAIKRRIYL